MGLISMWFDILGEKKNEAGIKMHHDRLKHTHIETLIFKPYIQNT